MTKPNAIYIMGGGGTAVVSATARGLMARTYEEYRSKINTFFAAVGGMRGAINEDITDVFAWSADDPLQLQRLGWPSWPVFRTGRHKPDERDCRRLLDVFRAHSIEYVFLNGGNDTMETALLLKEQSNQLRVVGIPKTVDNDLLETHRCPGYASFAKQVALVTMGLSGDLASFTLQRGATRGGRVREGAAAQVLVTMGRDQGWGAAASVIGKIDESYGPHVVVTKEGGFNDEKFLTACEKAWHSYEGLVVVAAEGAHDGTDYVANRTDVRDHSGKLRYKLHLDPRSNAGVTDGRLGLYLKLLIEANLQVPAAYTSLKARAEGPGYRDRNDPEYVSAVDFRDAIAVGARAADLMFGRTPVDGVMVTLTAEPRETDFVPLKRVADPRKGSKYMVRPLASLDTPSQKILTHDGLMVNRSLYMQYAERYVDLNGPQRGELLRPEGLRYPLEIVHWNLEKHMLAPYA